MQTLDRALRAACTAAAVLALCATCAGANVSLLVEPAGEFTATSEGKLTFQDRGGFLRIACNVTFTGMLSGGIEKVAVRSLEAGPVAEIKTARTAECTETLGGAAEAVYLVEAERPFLLRYEAFLGTLPNITGLLATSLATKVQFGAAGIRCLYEGEIGLLIAIEAGRASRFSFLESATRLISGSETCPREGVLRGRMRLSVAQTVTLETAAARGGALRAEPDPMRIERNMERNALLLTNTGRIPLFVRGSGALENRGEIEVRYELTCARWLFVNERCAVIARKRRVPAEGSIVLEYRIGNARAEERRVRYDAE